MLHKVLSSAKQIFKGSPNYMVQFLDRDPLKVYLGKPAIIRALRGLVYKWTISEESLILRCSLSENCEKFRDGETFRALVRVGKKNCGTLTIEAI